jgi:hypothetical protein
MNQNRQWISFVLLTCLVLSACKRAEQSSYPHQAESLMENEKLPTMKVAQAVMVTVELDFGGKPPTIETALKSVERRSKPDDGQGRTFAILDAYGEPMPDGKLHISMHISTEKPGTAALVFRPTGKILWQTRILPSEFQPTGKQLMIMINDGQGRDYLLDGSMVKNSIMESIVRDRAVVLRDFWPDGAEREVTIIYSTCGCPVKVSCRRFGDATQRTKEMPVIFPDDPAVVSTIERLMGWQPPIASPGRVAENSRKAF